MAARAAALLLALLAPVAFGGRSDKVEWYELLLLRLMLNF